MVSARPDLNGARITTPGSPQVWLMFNGMRHYIVNSAVYEALFAEADKLVPLNSVDDILRGPDLNEGTCLVQGEAEGAIYLVTGFPRSEVRRCHVRSWDDFLAFGFAEERVRVAPDLLLLAIPIGRPLQAAREAAWASP